MAASRFQQHVGAVDIGLDEGVGVHDGAVDVRLGREIDDSVHVMALYGRRHGFPIADVAADEMVARVFGH